MSIDFFNIIRFGYITEDTFELRGQFPVSLNTPCSQAFLDKLKKNDFWCYSPSKENKIFGQPTNCTMSGVNSKEHGQFMVQCLSFLYGQKLFTRKYEYVDSVRLKRDCWGLLISNKSIEKGLMYCNELWGNITHNKAQEQISRLRKRIFGIIHLLFMSTSKKALQFERFMYIYIAIDACFKHLVETGEIKNTKNHIPHRERIKNISAITGVKFSQTITEQFFYSTRNDIFHEGIYLDEPLGYRATGVKKNLSFAQNFLVQVIFFVLGIKATGFLETVDSLNMTCVTIE